MLPWKKTALVFSLTKCGSVQPAREGGQAAKRESFTVPLMTCKALALGANAVSAYDLGATSELEKGAVRHRCAATGNTRSVRCTLDAH